MTRRGGVVLGLLVCAAGLYVAARLVSPRPAPQAAIAAARSLARPLALPLLWHGIEQARRQGRVGEVFERGRLLLALLPCWVDGHVFFADRLAFSAAPARAQARAGLDALTAALALLEESARACPAKADEALVAMAFLVEQRGRRWPELAAAFRERYGVDPRERAAAYLERAERLHGSKSLRERRAYLAVRLIAPALERSDLELARARVDEAVRLLQEVADQETAAHQRAALLRLGRYLAGDPTVDREALLKDPWLQDLAEVLAKGK